MKTLRSLYRSTLHGSSIRVIRAALLLAIVFSASSPVMAQAQSNSDKIYLGVKTGSNHDAGTDADIYAIFEINGRQSTVKLDKWAYDDFEAGSFDWYELVDARRLKNASSPLTIWLQLKDGDDWYIQEICLTQRLTTDSTYRPASLQPPVGRSDAFGCHAVGSWLEEGRSTFGYSFGVRSQEGN